MKQAIINECQSLRLRINQIESDIIQNKISEQEAKKLLMIIEKEIRFLEEKVLS